MLATLCVHPKTSNMRNPFAHALLKTLKLRSKGLTKEELAYRVLPNFLLEIITRYLRVTCTAGAPSRPGSLRRPTPSQATATIPQIDFKR